MHQDKTTSPSRSVQTIKQGANPDWNFQNLYDFNPNSDSGNMPNGTLVADAFGNLYGVTNVGGLTNGDPSGHGVLFKLTPQEFSPICPSYSYSVLHHFQGGTTDGARPVGGLLATNGGTCLYGTTGGGGTGWNGIVFMLSLTIDGSSEYSVLYNFSAFSEGQSTNLDGAAPTSRLIMDSNGILYGTTSVGGAYGGGTVFMLSPSENGYIFAKLHDFGASTGYNDFTGGLTMDVAGNLYGLKTLGGANAAGDLFMLQRSKGAFTYKTLYSFQASENEAPIPIGDLAIDQRGCLYGTTSSGGSSFSGSVFKYDPSNLSMTTLYSFDDITAGGSDPCAGVVLDSAGNIFGTASEGQTGNGTVFMLKNDDGGTYTHSTLFDFLHSRREGGAPQNNLIFDTFGNLCGTTMEGGMNQSGGTVFKLVDMRTAKGIATMEVGVVLSVSLLIGGVGYTSAPTVWFDPPSNGITAQAIAVITNGSVSSVKMTNNGSGYDFNPGVYFTSPP